MQYKQRAIVIFPLLHEPKSAVHAWDAPETPHRDLTCQR